MSAACCRSAFAAPDRIAAQIRYAARENSGAGRARWQQSGLGTATTDDKMLGRSSCSGPRPAAHFTHLSSGGLTWTQSRPRTRIKSPAGFVKVPPRRDGAAPAHGSQAGDVAGAPALALGGLRLNARDLLARHYPGDALNTSCFAIRRKHPDAPMDQSGRRWQRRSRYLCTLPRNLAWNAVSGGSRSRVGVAADAAGAGPDSGRSRRFAWPGVLKLPSGNRPRKWRAVLMPISECLPLAGRIRGSGADPRTGWAFARD